jgi:hypothetical protein
MIRYSRRSALCAGAVAMLAVLAACARATSPDTSSGDFLTVVFSEQRAGALSRVDARFRSGQHCLVAKADTPDSTFPPHVAMYHFDAAGGMLSNRAYTDGAKEVVLEYTALGRTIDARSVPGSSPPAAVVGKHDLQTYTMFVSTSAAPGQDAEFNRWYDEQHVPDVLRIPGFSSARRYALKRVATAGVAMAPYLVLFTVQTYDLELTIADLKRRVRTGVTKMTPAFGPGGHVYYMAATGQSDE